MAPLYPSFTPTYHHDQYPAINPTRPELDCSQKIIMITGAGRGIGKAIAIAFAQAYAQGIILLGRTHSTLESTAEEVQKASGGKTDVLVTTADITQQTDVQQVFESARSHFNKRVPDVLVNAAGGFEGGGSIIDVDILGFMKAFDINVRGPLTVAQSFLQASQQSSPDTPKTLINVSSGVAHTPFSPTFASYSTSKVANAKLCEYIHHENPSWNVFNLHPGVVATDLARQVGRAAPDSPELPAGFVVWLAAHPDARQLNGKFLWANWDVDELLGKKEEIQKTDLLTLTLKGWAVECNGEDLKRRAASVHRG